MKLTSKINILLFILSSAITINILCMPAKTSALSGGEFNNGNIIDDTVFFNNSTINPSMIQAFLNSKVPVCDNSGSGASGHAGYATRADWGAAHGAPAPYTCLKDYSQTIPSLSADAYCGAISGGTKSSADIIYSVAQSCSVNAKALIVLLQKEQSLVTDEWPWPIQYRSATGYGCPDTAACDAEYYGFFNQVYNAAHQFQRYSKQAERFNFKSGTTSNVLYNPNTACGGSNVNISNRATAALYNYTPYQPNAAALNNLYGTGDGCSAYGNRNFWRLFNDWFGSTKLSGKWLRQSTVTGQVWLVADGLMPDGSYAQKKYRLANYDTFISYRLQFEPVIPVSEEYLSQYTDDGTLSTISTSRDYPHIQFMDNGNRYAITTGEICTAWGFECFNTNIMKTIPGSELHQSLPGLGVVPPVMVSNNVAYRLQDGKKHPIADGESFSDLGFSWNNVIWTQEINARQPLGPLQISHQVALQFTPTTPVVLYDPATFTFHKVPSYDVYSAWNMGSQALLNPPTSTYTSSPPANTSPDVSVWSTDGTSKYLVDQGRKINVTNNTSDMPSPTWQNFELELLSKLPTAAFGPYTRLPNGAVNLLQAGNSRHVPSWQDFTGLGLNIAQLLPISNYTKSLFPDGAQKLADGSLFANNSGIWMVDGNSKYHIPSWSYLTYFNLNHGNILYNPNTSIDTAYTGTDDLTPLVQDSSGNKYLILNGNKSNINSSAITRWGINSNSFQTLTSNVLNKIPTTNNVGNFLLNQQYGLYYAENGTKHHLLSYNSYLSRGGNSGNTITVTDELFNLIPSGSDIQ